MIKLVTSNGLVMYMETKEDGALVQTYLGDPGEDTQVSVMIGNLHLPSRELKVLLAKLTVSGYEVVESFYPDDKPLLNFLESCKPIPWIPGEA